MCFQLVSVLFLPFLWGIQDKCFSRVCIFSFCYIKIHFKSVQCSKPPYWHNELFCLVSSCPDHPVTNVLDGASNVLANWLHEAAKLPLPGWLYEKDLFPAASGLSSLTERERKRGGYREKWKSEHSWFSLKEFRRSTFFLYRFYLIFDHISLVLLISQIYPNYFPILSTQSLSQQKALLVEELSGP